MESGSLFELTLSLHSLLRWTVLLTGALVFVQGCVGLLAGGDLGALGKRVQLGFMINVDLQVLLGIFVWMISPTVAGARDDMAAAMSDAGTRYFLVEHGAVMLLALVIVHVGRIAARRAANARAQHLRTAIYSGLALALMVLRIPWPFMEPGRPWLRLPF